MAVTMWQRSREAIARMEVDLTRDFVVPLKAEILRLDGHLPLEFPGNRVKDPRRAAGYRYPAADSVVALRRRQDEMILGHSPRVTSLIRSNGYFVVVFDRAAFLGCRGEGQEASVCLDRHLRVEWMEEPAFCKRIEAQHQWLEAQGRGPGRSDSRRGAGVAESAGSA
jgi:hypothetical protein